MTFDVEYARWLEEHNRQINELRAAVNSHAGDIELRTIVDNVMTHYEEIFRLKGVAAKADVFHILSGMWKTPAERCFMWIGGFRSSELLKVRTLSLSLSLTRCCILSYMACCSKRVAIWPLKFLVLSFCLMMNFVGSASWKPFGAIDRATADEHLQLAAIIPTS